MNCIGPVLWFFSQTFLATENERASKSLLEEIEGMSSAEDTDYVDSVKVSFICILANTVHYNVHAYQVLYVGACC